MRWTNDAPADLARLTTKLWRAVIVAGRLLIIGIVFLACSVRWLDAQGQLGPGTRSALLPVVVVLSLSVGFSWPYLLFPVSPRRLLEIRDGFVAGDTVLGPRRVSVDGLTLRSSWFPLTKWPFDGMIFLLRDRRGRSLLLLDRYPDRSTDAAVPDVERSISRDASELPPLGASMQFERQRPITGRDRLLGWLGLVGVVLTGLGLIFVLLTVVFP